MSFSSNDRAWGQMIRKMPTESYGIAAAAFPWRNQIALIGRDLCHTFNVDDQTWQELPRMHEERFFCGAVLHPDFLFVMGGKDKSSNVYFNSMEKLPLDSNGRLSQQQSWQLMPNMTTRRGYCGAAVIDDDIFVIGGLDGKQALRSAQVFLLKENRWVSLPDMIERRFDFAVAVVRDCLYAFGGMGRGKCTDTVEVFDTKTKSWSPLPNMPRARSRLAAVAVGDKIFILGGRDTTKKNLVEVDIFDTVAMRWETYHPYPDINPGRCACGAVYNQGKLLMFGGVVQSCHVLDTIGTINVEGPPDYSEFGTRAEVEAEIAKVETQRDKECGGDEFDPSTILRSQRFAKKISRLESLCSRMPTVEALRAETSRLENEMRRLKVQQESVSRLLPLSMKRKELLEQLQKEESARDGLSSQPLPKLVFSKSTWATKLLSEVCTQGEVYLGIRRLKSNAKQEVAIKVFDRSDWEECKTELKNLLRLPHHPNVVDVLDFYQIPQPAIVMEYIVGGNLWDHLHREEGPLGPLGPLGQRDAKDVLCGIGVGLEHLHKHGVVHRDLKPENVLLRRCGSSIQPVLVDLGHGNLVSQFLSVGKSTGIRGTTGYMAPEMMRDYTWSRKTDMYSLGIVMWEIFTGRVPFEGLLSSDVCKRVCEKKERPDINALDKVRASEGQKRLIQDLWSQEADNRPTADRFLLRIPNA